MKKKKILDIFNHKLITLLSHTLIIYGMNYIK